MKINCELFLDGKRFKGFITINNGSIVFYRKRFFLKEKPLYKISLKSISDVEVRWRIFYIKGIIRVSTGFYIKEITLKGDKRLAEFLDKLSSMMGY